MSFSAGRCPKCDEYILQKNGVPFLVCPICDGSVSAREGAEYLDATCANAKNISEIIAKCLKLEQMHGSELPFKILTILSRKFPYNEEVAYLLVAMSDYSGTLVHEYLAKFAAVRKNVSFAAEFLENAMTFKNMTSAKLFEQYIENKLPASDISKWKTELAAMKEEFKGRSDSPAARNLLFTYYIGSALFNFALACFCIIVNVKLLLAVFLVMSVFMLEVGLLFLHNRKFGNRIEIGEPERLFMVIFMCSLVIAIGGVFLGVVI